MSLLEGVGDVLEKEEAEADVLVLGCVHAAAQRIRHLPKLSFVTNVGPVVCLFLIVLLSTGHYPKHRGRKTDVSAHVKEHLYGSDAKSR